MEVFGRFQLRFDGGLTVSVVLVGVRLIAGYLVRRREHGDRY